MVKHELFCERLYTLSFNSLKILTLPVKLEEFALESDRWDLPTLATLLLKCPPSSVHIFNYRLTS